MGHHDSSDPNSQWRHDALILERMSAEASAGAAAAADSRYEMQVPVDKVRLLIGTKGANINQISQLSRCRLNVDSESAVDGGMAIVTIQALRTGVPMNAGTKPLAGEELREGDAELAVKLIRYIHNLALSLSRPLSRSLDRGQ